MPQKQGSSQKLKHANRPRKAAVAKAGRRSGSSQHKRKDYVVRPDQTYSYGLAQDSLKQRGLEMLDVLQCNMHSASADAEDTLKNAVVVYVGNFADINWHRGEHPAQRHSEAMKVACADMSPSMRSFAIRQFKTAFKVTNP